MPIPSTPTDDRGFESALGRLLGIGVLASSSLSGLGLVLAFLRPADGAQPMLLTQVCSANSYADCRVTVSAFTYARRRDWLFAALTASCSSNSSRAWPPRFMGVNGRSRTLFDRAQAVCVIASEHFA